MYKTEHFAEFFGVTFDVDNARLVFQSRVREREILVYVCYYYLWFILFVSVYRSARYSRLHFARRTAQNALVKSGNKRGDYLLRDLITVLTITTGARIHCDITRWRGEGEGKRKFSENAVTFLLFSAINVKSKFDPARVGRVVTTLTASPLRYGKGRLLERRDA